MAERSNGQLRPVERLEVQVLVDNVMDILSTNPDFVQSEQEYHIQRGVPVLGGDTYCCGHWGHSSVLTLHADGRKHGLLFDAGPEGHAVERNGARLAVDFGSIEAAVLSHGHWDHAGGLPAALRLIYGANGGRPVPCYLHPGMFASRANRRKDGGVQRLRDVPGPAELESAGAAPQVTTEPALACEGHAFVSGEIPRITSYERGLPRQMRRTADGQDWEPDPLIMDERFLAVHVQGKGLVVFSACSHAGIVNVLSEARRLFPEVPPHAVVGGMHLAGADTEPIIPDTVRDLAGFELRWIVPCHCTGWRAVTALVNAFGEDRVAPGAVGKRITF